MFIHDLVGLCVLVYVLSIPCASLAISYCRSTICMSVYALSIPCMFFVTSYYRSTICMLCNIISVCHELMIYMLSMLGLAFTYPTHSLNIYPCTAHFQYCMYPTCLSYSIYSLCVMCVLCPICILCIVNVMLCAISYTLHVPCVICGTGNNPLKCGLGPLLCRHP